MNTRLRVTLRMYLPDFMKNFNINVEELEKVYDRNMAPTTLHLWYDEGDDIDLKVLKEFIKSWEARQHFKTIIKSSFTNIFSEFIWFDIIPFKFAKKATHNRLSFTYVQAHNVINGIKRFNEILSFTSSPKPNKVQKRTDYNYDENSDSRKS